MIFYSPWLGNHTNDGANAKTPVSSWQDVVRLYGKRTDACDLVVVYRDGTLKKFSIAAPLPRKFRYAFGSQQKQRTL